MKKIILISSILFSTAAMAGPQLLVSNNTLTKECGPQGLYVGPNRADLHGGSCLYMPGKNINHVLSATYTLNQSHCPYVSGSEVYVGPWKASEHGGYCLSVKDFSHMLFTSKTLNRNQCSNSPQYGTTVYVGPWKEGEHGGYCLTVFN